MNDGDTSSSESDDDDDNDKMVIDLEEEPPSSKTDPKTPPSTPSPSPLQTTRRMTRSQTRISPVPMEVLEAATSRRRKRSVDREDAGSAEKSSATKKSVKGRKASGGSTESSGASKPTQTKKRGRRPAILDTDTEEEEQNEVKVPEAANESNLLDPNLMEMLKKSDEFVRNRNAEAAKQEQPPSSAATSQPAPNKEVLSATVAVESGAKLTPAAMTAPVTPTSGTASQPGPSQPTSLGSFVSDALARLKAEKHNHFLAKTQQRQPLNFLGDIMSAQTSMFEPKQRMEAEEGSQAKETKFVLLISVITFDRIGRFSVLKDLVARTTKILLCHLSDGAMQ